MKSGADLSLRCDHEVGCITCGDTAVALRVVSVEEERGLALCEASDGARETVETSLVEPVRVGTALLVHAGVALQQLAPDEVGAR